MKNLINIQAELKCPKGSFNAFGKYKYRSVEQILESLKPVLLKHNSLLIMTDEIEEIGNKLFLKATAEFVSYGEDGKKTERVVVNGYAEMGEHKGMSSEQCTGTASSYARKYALNGLFLIDETESDPDSKDNSQQVKKPRTITDERFNKAIEAIGKGLAKKEDLLQFELTESQKLTFSTL
jgi:hypothetical protein